MSSQNEALSSQKQATKNPRGQILTPIQDAMHQPSTSPLSSWHILLFLVVFRVINSLCIQTFFQPDEYFQSLEPAWEMAFGPQSGAWITWASTPQLYSMYL